MRVRGKMENGMPEHGMRGRDKQVHDTTAHGMKARDNQPHKRSSFLASSPSKSPPFFLGLRGA